MFICYGEDTTWGDQLVYIERKQVWGGKHVIILIAIR